MEKTYMKYMKQGSGTDYEMKKGPEKTKKAPVPGWITYDMNEVRQGLLDTRKVDKLIKAEMIVIKNQLKSLEQDVKNKDYNGINVSVNTIGFSLDRISKAL
jgi:inhibitor of KinA sporulation pathway (predicted exonuclease)